MSKPAQAGESNGAGRAFLPLSKPIRVRVGRARHRPYEPPVRTRAMACVGTPLRLVPKSGLASRY